jgi:hypothetical protein
MKKLFLATLLLSTTWAATAQGTSAQTTSVQTTTVKMAPVDKSPMDMVYFPDNYPILKIQDKAKEPLIARVIYSRPQKADRTVFGDLVEYGKVWRLGANEATEVEFFKEVKIDGKRVPKGKYTLYAITSPEQWTFIVNKETDTWGSFKYDEKKDLLRVNVPVQKEAQPVESFTVSFEKTAAGANLVINWDDVKTALPIALK